MSINNEAQDGRPSAAQEVHAQRATTDGPVVKIAKQIAAQLSVRDLRSLEYFCRERLELHEKASNSELQLERARIALERQE